MSALINTLEAANGTTISGKAAQVESSSTRAMATASRLRPSFRGRS
jgi:hypothetical protein